MLQSAPMATVSVDASTVRIAVDNTRELKRIVETHTDFVAVIHQGADKHLVVYDANAMLTSVIANCLQDSPQWHAQLSRRAS